MGENLTNKYAAELKNKTVLDARNKTMGTEFVVGRGWATSNYMKPVSTKEAAPKGICQTNSHVTNYSVPILTTLAVKTRQVKRLPVPFRQIQEVYLTLRFTKTLLKTCAGAGTHIVERTYAPFTESLSRIKNVPSTSLFFISHVSVSALPI